MQANCSSLVAIAVESAVEVTLHSAPCQAHLGQVGDSLALGAALDIIMTSLQLQEA